MCEGETKCDGNAHVSTDCEENADAGSAEILQG